MKKIILNKTVYEFLIQKVSHEEIERLMDCAIYYAEQNGTIEARRMGQYYEEAAVIASKYIAKAINEEFGETKLYYTIRCKDAKPQLLSTTQYCYVDYI